MERRPISEPLSDWELVLGRLPRWAAQAVEALIAGGAEDVRVWRRWAGDGVLIAIASTGPDGCHLSVTFRDRASRPIRYPRWDEIADARFRLLPDDVTMCMVLPPPEQYVALHDTCFHLYEHHDR